MERRRDIARLFAQRYTIKGELSPQSMEWLTNILIPMRVLKGTMLLSIAVLSASGYSVLLTRLLKKYSPATVTTWQNFIAIPFYIPFILIFDIKQWPAMIWDSSTILSLLCLAILCSAGAYMLYSYSVKQLTVTKTCIFTNLIPIVTLLAAASIGQETFTQMKFWGILVIVIGVTFSQMTVKLKATPSN